MNTFRLTVWHPFRSDRDLHYPMTVGTTEDPQTFISAKLQEVVYSWSPEQDVLAGITDEPLRAELRTLLFSSFAASLSPQQRNFGKLAEVIERLEQLTNEETACNWTDTVQTDNFDEDSSLRCSPTIALYHHLHWLLEVFGNVPGLSVMIR